MNIAFTVYFGQVSVHRKITQINNKSNSTLIVNAKDREKRTKSASEIHV